VLAPAAAVAESPSLAALGIKGEATLKNFSHFDETATDRRNFRDEGLLEITWSHRWERQGSLSLVLQARDDDAGLAEGITFQIPETSARRSLLAVKEAVATVRRGPFELGVGKQIFAWGTADAFNPTDRINPYDYLDILDNEKMAVWSAAARLEAGPASLTFVVVPFFTPSRLPLRNSRWTPLPPPGFVAVVDGREVPDRAVDNMQYAARLKTTVKGWDLSVSYYDGFEDTPAFRRSAAGLGPGVVVPRFTPVFTRARVAGADFSTTWRGFEFHGEGAFSFVESNGRQDDFQAIVGFNRTWDGLGLRWLERVVLILEYARETVLRTHPGSPIVEAGSAGQVGDLIADNAFRDTVVSRLRLEVSDDTKIQLTGLADLASGPSHYAQLKVSHRPRDAWLVEAGVDVLGGPRQSFWGRWRDNDRFFLSVKYFF
jgi:hypothetical protein